MSEFHFQTRGFAVGYNGKALIRDISIGVKRGEIVSLIGPNGAGKSTILKSVARQLAPLAGTAYIGKDDLFRLPARQAARRMAVMLTERANPKLMTAWEVAAAGRYPYTGRLGILSPADEASVSRALDTVGALDLAQREFDTLSDGQRQRVLLARALCQEPEILLLDEPTSYMDLRHKLELLSLLRDMTGRQGLTVILSLHEIDLAQKISDRVLCVKGETIARWGAPREVFTEENIRSLYGIDRGCYDPLFGSVELPAPEGDAQVFVSSACGTGIPVFRRLQQEGVPFRAGILFTNDVDYHLARLLASEVVAEQPFHEIGDAAFARALELVRGADRVIDAGTQIGPANRRMEDLLREAERLGKLEKWSDA